MTTRLVAGRMACMAAACTPVQLTAEHLSAASCAARIGKAAAHLESHAGHRQEMMHRMRFGSAEALRAYVGENDRLSAESERLFALRVKIAAADACAARFT